MRLDDPKRFAEELHAIGPDLIFHLAATTKVEECTADPKLARITNVEASALIAAAAKDLGARLIFTSTDLVYSGKGPHTEDEDCDPESVYARTKLEAERALIASGADCVVARMANAYGPVLSRHGSFTSWIEKRLARGERVPLYVDQLRSFIYAPDAAKALLLLAEKGKSREIYNVGGPRPVSRVEFGELFFDAFGYDKGMIKPISIEDDPQAQLRGEDCSMSIGKIRALGFTPMDVKQALEHWRRTEGT